MKTIWILLAFATLASARPAVQKLQLTDLPPAVRKTVDEQTKGATLKGLSKEVEGGKTQYEVETSLNGKSRDMLIDGSGKVIEIETEVAVDTLPAAVKATLMLRGKIVKVESVTKGAAGSITYEATIEKSGKKSEVAVNGDGKVVR